MRLLRRLENGVSVPCQFVSRQMVRTRRAVHESRGQAKTLGEMNLQFVANEENQDRAQG
jgi:hypothetical protein